MSSHDDPVKRKERNAHRLNLDMNNKERRAEFVRLMRVTKIDKPTSLVMHLISLGNKIYGHKEAGGVLVLRGPRGGEEELELL